jgi:hypothetical protein
MVLRGPNLKPEDEMTDVMLAFANARAGREDAFDAWYSEEHVPAVLAVDGVQSARRFRAAADLPGGPEHPYTFLAIYEIASGEVPSAVQGLIAARPQMSEDVDGAPLAWCFEEVSPRIAGTEAGDGPFDHMVVFTNAREGTDEEFNRWYDEVHIPDILTKIGGYAGAHRFRRADVPFNRNCPWGYMALYDIPKGTMAHCLERIVWSRTEREEAEAAGRVPQVSIAPAMADERASWFYRALVPDRMAVA